MYISDTHLKSFLADAGLVSQKDFDAADAEAKEKREDGGRYFNGEKSRSAKMSCVAPMHISLGIPFVSLTGTVIEYETLSLIPEPVARRNNIIAYAQKATSSKSRCSTPTTLPRSISSKRRRISKFCRVSPTRVDQSRAQAVPAGLKDNLGDVIARETEALKTDGGRGSPKNQI
jgi:hypothetical protein